MKCVKCGHVVGPAIPLTLNAEVRGERFDISVTAPKCEHCGRVTLDARARRIYHRAGSDAYRSHHGLLTAAQIDQLRRSLGMTWKQFADYVDIGIATLKRWMGGEIQSDAYNSLVRLKADPKYIEQTANDLASRLAETSGCVQQVVAVPSPTALRRSRKRVQQGIAADSQYALAA